MRLYLYSLPLYDADERLISDNYVCCIDREPSIIRMTCKG